MSPVFDGFALGCGVFAAVCAGVDWLLSKETKDRMRNKLGDWWLHLEYSNLDAIARTATVATQSFFCSFISGYRPKLRSSIAYGLILLLGMIILYNIFGFDDLESATFSFGTTWALLTFWIPIYVYSVLFTHYLPPLAWKKTVGKMMLFVVFGVVTCSVLLLCYKVSGDVFVRFVNLPSCCVTDPSEYRAEIEAASQKEIVQMRKDFNVNPDIKKLPLSARRELEKELESEIREKSDTIIAAILTSAGTIVALAVQQIILETIGVMYAVLVALPILLCILAFLALLSVKVFENSIFAVSKTVLLRIHESQTGVLTLIGVVLAAIAKLVQEGVKYFTTS